MEVAAAGSEHFTDEERRAVVTTFPRGADFEHDIIDAFRQGMKHRPDSTYGTFNDDVLAFKDPGFQRKDFCSIVLRSPWTRTAGEPARRVVPWPVQVDRRMRKKRGGRVQDPAAAPRLNPSTSVSPRG